MHRIKVFFRDPPLTPRCTASMVAAAKTRVQQLPPLITAYPLSLSVAHFLCPPSLLISFYLSSLPHILMFTMHVCVRPSNGVNLFPPPTLPLASHPSRFPVRVFPPLLRFSRVLLTLPRVSHLPETLLERAGELISDRDCPPAISSNCTELICSVGKAASIDPF